MASTPTTPGPSGTQKERVTNNQVRLAEINQKFATWRVGIICATILFGIALVVFAVIQITQPPWVTVAIALGTAILGPSGLIALLMRLRLKYLAKYHRHLAQLEERLDPDRSSSRRGLPRGEDADEP